MVVEPDINCPYAKGCKVLERTHNIKDSINLIKREEDIYSCVGCDANKCSCAYLEDLNRATRREKMLGKISEQLGSIDNKLLNLVRLGERR